MRDSALAHGSACNPFAQWESLQDRLTSPYDSRPVIISCKARAVMSGGGGDDFPIRMRRGLRAVRLGECSENGLFGHFDAMCWGWARSNEDRPSPFPTGEDCFVFRFVLLLAHSHGERRETDSDSLRRASRTVRDASLAAPFFLFPLCLFPFPVPHQLSAGGEDLPICVEDNTVAV